MTLHVAKEILFRKGNYGIFLGFSFWQFRLSCMFPHSGFSIFYLASDFCRHARETGYRIFSKGLADGTPVLAVSEQCVLLSEWELP